MRSSIVMFALLLTACSGQVASKSEPHQDEAPLVTYGLRDDDAGHAPALERTPNRVRNHGGPVLASPHLQIIYVGTLAEIGSPPSRDDVIRYTITSGAAYWDRIAQYGVHAGRIDGSSRIPKAALLTAALLKNGPVIPVEDLEARVHEVLHPTSGAPLVPKADAYVFFLPDGINVSFGSSGSKVYTSCIDVGAYHRYDGEEPYAVLPPCDLGRSARAISHELAEMATDPIVGTGWLSDNDPSLGIGEIADLCNRAADPPIGGYALTELWSNHDSSCVPQQ